LDNENASIEFHDSQLRGVVQIGDHCILFLRAYVHRTTGRPGIDSGTGWTQAAAIVLNRSDTDENSAGLPAEIFHGELTMFDGPHNLIPMPFSYRGSVGLRLDSEFSHIILIKSQGVSVLPIGDPVYVEEVCAMSEGLNLFDP